jgi:hypothetical protein
MWQEILCYTLTMSENQPIWIDWARTLKQWGINKGVASLLEAAGSLSVLLAQLFYLSQPLLAGTVSSRSIDTLAHLLDTPADRQAFVKILREAPSREPVS